MDRLHELAAKAAGFAAAPGLISALRVVLKNLVHTVAIGFGNENASAVIESENNIFITLLT
jgi:hypothetical protein